MTRKLLFVYVSLSLSLFTSSAGEIRNGCLVDGTFPECGTRKPGSRDCLMRFRLCESGVYSVHMRSFYRVILLCYARFSKEKSRACNSLQTSLQIYAEFDALFSTIIRKYKDS